ncbi:MAG: Uma2 family endonuclease [Acidobacteria bacterium]|nr:Uma2 family endonuclease [Acidobacteriota bacterium]MBI3424886.1 Uma2 family endonuclease [Acidobacteriota bacterium]
MGLAQRVSYLSVEDYLKYEKDSPVKHEYVDGQLYAMARASKQHVRIAGNLFNRLDDHLADDRCEPFISDMKVYVSETLFYYPDVVVTCDDPDPYYRREPVLVVEITSPTTERIDRNEKLPAYKRIKSLREILLVAQDRVQLEIYRRQPDGSWQTEVLTDLNEELHLQSVGLTLGVAQVYRRVQFDQLTAAD